ncbi:MAG: hypothetical protein ACLFU0_03520 [Alphaproteobacteria bacterium]
MAARAARYPASRFTSYDLTSYDLCPDAIAYAADAAAAAGLANVRFAVRDLSAFDEREADDLVTCSDVRSMITTIRRPRSARWRVRSGRAGTCLVQAAGGSARLENSLNSPLAALLFAVCLAQGTPVSIGRGGPATAARCAAGRRRRRCSRARASARSRVTPRP